MNNNIENSKYMEKKRQREQHVRTQKNIIYTVLVAIVVLLIVIVCMKLFQKTEYAKASLSGHYEYESIYVKEGDSIWTIAAENADQYTGNIQDYVEEIVSINGLNSEYIKAGDSIIIPVYVNIH